MAGSQPESRHPTAPAPKLPSPQKMTPPPPRLRRSRLRPFATRSRVSSPPRAWRAIARRPPPFVAPPPRRAPIFRAPRIGSSSPPRREPRAPPRPSPTRASTPTRAGTEQPSRVRGSRRRSTRRLARGHPRDRWVPRTDPARVPPPPSRRWTPPRVRRRRSRRPRSGSSLQPPEEDPYVQLQRPSRASRDRPDETAPSLSAASPRTFSSFPSSANVHPGTTRDPTRLRRWTAISTPSRLTTPRLRARTPPRRRRRRRPPRRVAATSSSIVPPTRRDCRADSPCSG